MVTISPEDYKKIKERQENARAKSLWITDHIILEKHLQFCSFVITWRIPSKKNSKRIAWRGRPTLLSSEEYLEWEKKAIDQISHIKINFPPPYSIEMKIWYPDNRKADNSNKFESIADMLVEAKKIPDDNWKLLSDIRLIAMWVDKENPRAEITIKSI